jgi:hypothetical protein
MTKPKRVVKQPPIVATKTIETPPPGAFALSAQTVVLRETVAVPNRALALLERDGDTWHFVRAHLWFEGMPPVSAAARLSRSQP